jgi:hypothetical protein
MIKRTDFGPGRLSNAAYTVAGAAVVGPAAALTRTPIETIFEESLFHAVVVGRALAFSVGCGVVGSRISSWHKRKEQAKRDIRATHLMEACRSGSGDVGDFSLYLRAFETTGQMPFQRLEAVGYDGRSGHDVHVDFETSLAEALEKDAPVVALGRPGEHFGAGRILTDDASWQEDLAVLAKSATLLLVLPSTRPGTQWEIDWIIDNRMLHKTLWLQPPTQQGRLQDWLGLNGQRFDWKSAWQPILERLGERGISVPAYQKDGAIFTFGNDGRLVHQTDLQGDGDAPGLVKRINQHLLSVSQARRK